jgi:hypothetical protein
VTLIKSQLTPSLQHKSVSDILVVLCTAMMPQFIHFEVSVSTLSTSCQPLWHAAMHYITQHVWSVQLQQYST